MTISRRRFLRIASAGCLLPHAAAAFRWQGTALGAHAQIILDHPNAKEITRRALAEIDRLESIFSLYRATSEITRLNATGHLTAPSFEMLECLSIAKHVHTTTKGCFDPTVQPLWQVLANAAAFGQPPNQTKLEVAQMAVGFQRATFDTTAVTLASDQQITLNGIAQGYIADRVADLMRSARVKDVLIDTGEILALGNAKGRAGWSVTITGESEQRSLTQRALATSAPLGTVLDAGGRIGHILDPLNMGLVDTNIRQVSISAPKAALADALSTGLCVVKDEAEMRRILRGTRDARLESVKFKTDLTNKQENDHEIPTAIHSYSDNAPDDDRHPSRRRR